MRGGGKLKERGLSWRGCSEGNALYNNRKGCLEVGALSLYYKPHAGGYLVVHMRSYSRSGFPFVNCITLDFFSSYYIFIYFHSFFFSCSY